MRVKRGRSRSAASASAEGCGASATSRGTMLWRNTAIRPGFTGWGGKKNGAPLRPPIQSEQFAPLAGGQIAALLQRTTTHQRQQSQGQKDRLQWVESRR